MSVRITQNSFSKGVLSPSLSARIDLEQYKLGVKKLVNGVVAQEGCILNRSGLEYLEEAKYTNKKTRLIPFSFNFSQNYIIELGHNYIRFIKNGSYILDNNDEIYEIQSPYSEDDIFEIDYIQQKDVLTLVHQNYSPRELVRYSHNNWELNLISFEATIAAPTGLSISYTGSRDSHTKRYRYVVTSVDSNTLEESKRSSSISTVAHQEAYWTTSEYITLSWSAVNGANEYNVYRAINGIYGYIGTTTNTSFVDNNIEPDMTSSAPVNYNPFSNENPSCVCNYQQRKIYACSSNSPETIWASQSGTSNNFNYSRPLNATDSITLTISENSANKIQHMLPFDDLIIMTTGAEWCTNGSDGIFSANPAPVVKLQSYYGSSKIKPVISGSMVLFVQSGGSIVRDLGYNYLNDSYDGEELSLLANHLFEGKKVVDMAYSKEPNRLLYCVMDDGTLNVLTYNPKQKISAWASHKTQGCFESVAVIRENNEDIAYFVIKRKISGGDVKYIERFKSRTITSLNDSFFLDCAVSAQFQNEVTSISGLSHLKNMKVTALLDFGVVEDLQVDSSGNLELPYGAKNILVGLPYTFEFESLNIEGEGTLGIKKLINKVEVKVFKSREDFFIENYDGTLNQNGRCLDSINHPDRVYSKNVEFCPLDYPDSEKSIKLIQKYPLPLNILAVSATISVAEVEQI